MRGRIQKETYEARQTWWSRAQMTKGQGYRNKRKEGIKIFLKSEESLWEVLDIIKKN